MSEHPIEGLMDVTMQKIKEMVDVNTIVGDPITTQDGTVIIPVSKVSYGFASGGSDIPSKNAPNKEIFGGGSGAGVSINPIAFLAVYNGKVELLNIESYDGTADRVVGLVPEIIDKVSALFKKDTKEKKEEADQIKLDDPQV
ncbi:MAG: GerW family sporulation protein [Acutalibacteraceae bacterium]|nr:GerW family sporulation protein [Acutalibacteraceae bacterium]HIR02711.1 GerW family sporulation protein [Candidatus Scatovicinus merdipullorum]